MNRPYRELFDQVSASDALRREVQMMTTREQTYKRIRLTKTAVIAAVLALLLAGSAVAAQLFQIRDWFAERWQEETGTMISVDQLGLIDRLTQEIGVSDTENGVTITVDSATQGERILWLLLRIDGDVPVPEEARFFSGVRMTFSPEIQTEGFAYSFEDAAVREDGSLMVLLRCVPPLTGSDTFLERREVTLTLENLNWDGEPAAEGLWEMTFPLEAMEVPESLPLNESITVRGISLVEGEPVTVEYDRVRITPTEIWLHTKEALGEEVMVPGAWGLRMEDGSEIMHNGGVTYPGPGGGMESVYYWRVPVDLAQVTALTFGEIEVPLVS